jgi:hypothetical protein
MVFVSTVRGGTMIEQRYGHAPYPAQPNGQRDRVEPPRPGAAADALADLEPALIAEVPDADAWRLLHLATWGQRAVAWALDAVIAIVMCVPGAVALVAGDQRVARGQAGGRELALLGLALVVAAVAATAWQLGWRQGRRGQSWGKQLRGLYLVGVRNGQPLGGLRGLARLVIRVPLSALVAPQVASYLWPLWDARRQTWEDKAVGSVVTAGR